MDVDPIGVFFAFLVFILGAGLLYSGVTGRPDWVLKPHSESWWWIDSRVLIRRIVGEKGLRVWYVLVGSLFLLGVLYAVAHAEDATSLGPHREWTLSGGLASGYGYGAEPKPVPADLRHLKPTSTVSFGLARQRASGRGYGLRVDGMQYNDHHATHDLFGTPISVRRRATVLAASALVRWRAPQRHGMGVHAAAGPTLVFVDWRYDATAAGTPELTGTNSYVTAGLRGEIGLARRTASGWVGGVEFGGFVTLPAGDGLVVGDPSGLEPLHLGQALLTIGHTF